MMTQCNGTKSTQSALNDSEISTRYLLLPAIYSLKGVQQGTYQDTKTRQFPIVSRVVSTTAYIRKFVGSSLSTKASYSQVLSAFPQSLQENGRIERFLPYALQIITH